MLRNVLLVMLIGVFAAPFGFGAVQAQGQAAAPRAGVRTLIVTNYQKLGVLYSPEDASAIAGRLAALAADPRVDGLVVPVETEPGVAAAYTAWDAAPLDPARANEVTDRIYAALAPRVAANPTIEYLVLVGDDRVIPFRRVDDATPFPEHNYAFGLDATTVGAALLADKYLTDDFYANRVPIAWSGGALYLPELAAGRLVESPAEILGQIDYFLAHPAPRPLNRRLIVGHDILEDEARRICKVLGADMGLAGLDCDLTGDVWTLADLRSHLFSAPHDLISLSTHAAHSAYGTPSGGSLTASEVAANPVDLAGALVFQVGPHAGLNVPPDAPSPRDWPQVFAAKQALYLGPTGFSWGSAGGIELSEALAVSFAEQLVQGDRQRVGPALVAAKQAYAGQVADTPDATNMKCLMIQTLFGLPMVEVTTLDASLKLYLPAIRR